MPIGRRPPAPHGPHHSSWIMSRRSGDGDYLDPALAVLALGVPDDLPVENRLLERHRDVILSLKADRGLELVAILDRRQPHAADGDPLVRDADPDVARELVLGEELLEGGAERLGIGDLALAGRSPAGVVPPRGR